MPATGYSLLPLYSIHPQAHDSNLPLIDFGCSEANDLQPNHKCTHFYGHGDEGQLHLTQQIIPIASLQIHLVFSKDFICGSKLLAECSAHSTFGENGDGQDDQS
jgi:hypothetical protein